MRTWLAIIAGTTLSLAFAAEAQPYPNRPIRVIVPQPPGGGFDLVARVIAEPLARVMGNPVVVENRPGAGTLLARNDLPFGSLNEILAYARANPGKLTYASAGNGTGQHITAAVTFHLAGVQVTHVPYKGAAPAYQDLLPGRVDLFFDNSATAQPQIEARRVKPIAVSRTARLAGKDTEAMVARDIDKWTQLIRSAGIRAAD